MPMGMDHPALGAFAFAVTKEIGYCVAARWISTIYRRNPLQWLLIGSTRLFIGFAFGYSYYTWISTDAAGMLFLAGLIPIRIIEWLLLVSLFYDRRLTNPRRAWAVAAIGTVWSFILDIPAIIGYFMVGGFWIC